MKKIKQAVHKKGISLIELIIFISIFSTSLIFLLSSVTYSTYSFRNSQQKILATHFGEETFEWLKMQKESNATFSDLLTMAPLTPTPMPTVDVNVFCLPTPTAIICPLETNTPIPADTPVPTVCINPDPCTTEVPLPTDIPVPTACLTPFFTPCLTPTARPTLPLINKNNTYCFSDQTIYDNDLRTLTPGFCTGYPQDGFKQELTLVSDDTASKIEAIIKIYWKNLNQVLNVQLNQQFYKYE